MTDVFVTLRPPYLCPSEGHKHGVFIQSSINLGGTLLRITTFFIEWFRLDPMTGENLVKPILIKQSFTTNSYAFVVKKD